MRVYTIIGGVNGTGKSSLTGVLRAQRNDLGVIVDVDRITAQAGVSPIEGGKIAIRRIDDCLEKGISFTQESTLSGYRTAQTAAKAHAPIGVWAFLRLFPGRTCPKKTQGRERLPPPSVCHIALHKKTLSTARQCFGG